jgi:hypothetical protein
MANRQLQTPLPGADREDIGLRALNCQSTPVEIVNEAEKEAH